MASTICVNNKIYAIKKISRGEIKAINQMSNVDQQKALLGLIIGKRLQISDFDGRLNCLFSLTNKIKELISNGKADYEKGRRGKLYIPECFW